MTTYEMQCNRSIVNNVQNLDNKSVIFYLILTKGT